MRSVYDKACSYAFRCSTWDYKDLVHTCYLKFFEKHGTSLFDQDIRYIFRCLKWELWNQARKEKFSVGPRGENEIFSREFCDLDAVPIPTYSTSPERQVVSDDYMERVVEKIESYRSGHSRTVETRVLVEVASLLASGYNGVDISEQLGISTTLVSFYKKKIGKIIDANRQPLYRRKPNRKKNYS